MWVTFNGFGSSPAGMPHFFGTRWCTSRLSIELNGIDGPNVRHEILRKTHAIKQCRDSCFLHEACRVKLQSAQGAGRRAFLWQGWSCTLLDTVDGALPVQQTFVFSWPSPSALFALKDTNGKGSLPGALSCDGGVERD